MARPKLLVFASGTKDGGGSGFQKLVENSKTGLLAAEIVGVVSNYEQGGVWQIARHLGVPFFSLSLPPTAEKYQEVVSKTKAEWVALSGWLKLVKGLDPTKTINIHPGPLPDFGGEGMYGHRVHEAALIAFRQGKIPHSAVSMHFVTSGFDQGPVFFSYPVAILRDDTPKTLEARVNKYEHGWQSFVTKLVITGQISWQGESHHVSIPYWYADMPFCPPKLAELAKAEDY